MRWTAVSLAIAFVCVTANQAVAQKTANQVVAQKKVALVIGNDDYAHETPLQNPGRDAQLIGTTLQKLGFQLVGDRALIDLDKATTDRMVSLFEWLKMPTSHYSTSPDTVRRSMVQTTFSPSMLGGTPAQLSAFKRSTQMWSSRQWRGPMRA
jgi:Caspase domain